MLHSLFWSMTHLLLRLAICLKTRSIDTLYIHDYHYNSMMGMTIMPLQFMMRMVILHLNITTIIISRWNWQYYIFCSHNSMMELAIPLLNIKDVPLHTTEKEFYVQIIELSRDFQHQEYVYKCTWFFKMCMSVCTLWDSKYWPPR